MDALDAYKAQSRYNTWFNRRLFDVCARLSDEERRRDLGAFFGSVHRTLNHIILADHVWLMRLAPDLEPAVPRDRGGNVISLNGLNEAPYDDFDLLRERRVALDAVIEDWVKSIDPSALDRDVSYKTMAGVPMQHPLWWAVTHFFNHQTHHRGQVTTLLFQLGHDPGVTDLLPMLREEQRG